MSRPKAVITKSELAQVLRVSKARVSQYLRRGLSQATMPDGRIDREKALAWVQQNVGVRYSSHGEISTGERLAPPAGATPAIAQPGEIEVERQRLYELGFQQGAVLAGYRACCLLAPFAEACASDIFGTLMDRDPRAATVFPLAAAVTLMARHFAEELSRAREACLPTPEIRFDLFHDQEHARRLFGEAADLCKNLPCAVGPSGEPQDGVFGDAAKKASAVVANRLACGIAGHFCELSCAQLPAEESCEDVRLWNRIYPITLFRILMFGWCEAPLSCARAMGLPAPPGVRFELFGGQAAAAQEAFEEFERLLLEE